MLECMSFSMYMLIFTSCVCALVSVGVVCMSVCVCAHTHVYVCACMCRHQRSTLDMLSSINVYMSLEAESFTKLVPHRFYAVNK